ncbi:hypothetical protein QJS04_geneDACA004382 [Acorus gramineus]|uniref:Uncharacterized protein n=1 Tax=Acorus gramineus TaxID=55184 RepID=A0AAV9B264_ACOGR|nr:hypothetical protein QJS04_geneDACA004382 [Acorus gramineus]
MAKERLKAKSPKRISQKDSRAPTDRPKKKINKNDKHKKIKKKSGNPNFVPLDRNKFVKAKDEEMEEKKSSKSGRTKGGGSILLSTAPAAQQLRFFLDRYQSSFSKKNKRPGSSMPSNEVRLSPLEMEAFKEACMVELSKSMPQDVANISIHMKAIFGNLWKEVLCEGTLLEGKIEAGSPALFVISASALRSLELLRINKLIDIDALKLSRLSVIVLDLEKDAKGYSLLTLPQVKQEFWELYVNHFHQKLIQGDLRICFYGAISTAEFESEISLDK